MEKRYFADDRRQVIAISERIRRDLADFYGRTEKVEVIYHGVDAKRFSPANQDAARKEIRRQFGVSESDLVFLFMGDLRKGAAIAIEALARIPAGKLLLASATPAARFAGIAERLGISARVIFSPAVADSAPVFAAADSFVFPTPYDAFGMVISEAMATALPVISSREAGAAEWIRDGVNGLLLNSCTDSSELAQQMQRLMSDPQLRYALGEAARERVASHSWEAVANRTMQVYERVLAERLGR